MRRPPAVSSATPSPPPSPSGHVELVTLDPQATAALHIDFARLRQTPVYEPLIALRRRAKVDAPLDQANEECGFPVLDSISEVAMSAVDADTWSVAATLSVPAENALDCLRRHFQGTDTTLPDGTRVVGLWSDPSAAAAFVKDGVLYVGTPASIQRAAAADASKNEVAARTALSGDKVAAWYADEKGLLGRAVEGNLRASEKEIWLDTRLRMESAELAEKTAQGIQGIQARGEPKGTAPFATGVAAEGETVVLHLSGRQVRVTLMPLALAGPGVFLTEARKAEARRTADAIARAVTAAVERDKAARKPVRFPLTAPPVPKDVPRGSKYQSSDGDWAATWKEIGFRLDAAQYFRYSIVTAPDRKHTVVRAEGDVDGDGKGSLYEVPLEIDGKGEVSRGQTKVSKEQP
jgi:hypothetical protein